MTPPPLEPVVREVHVPVPPDRAFRRFTEEIGRWWPMAHHSVRGTRCLGVVFEVGVGGRIQEHGEDGIAIWGVVTAWDPPRRVAFTWHPGRAPDTAQEVDVTFVPEADGTRVRLVHRGWEALGDRALDARADYDRGWMGVLARFADAEPPVAPAHSAPSRG